MNNVHLDTHLVVVNRTSLSDLENFLRMVCYAYQYFKAENEGEHPVNFFCHPDVYELLDLPHDEIDGFLESTDDFINSLLSLNNGTADIFRSYIGEYYNFHFKPTDFKFYEYDKLVKFENQQAGQLLGTKLSLPGWVNTNDNVQTLLTCLKVEAEFENLITNKNIENNCIARSEIEYKISFIHLYILNKVLEVSSNLYLIERKDSFDTDDASTRTSIGKTSKNYENLGKKTKATLKGKAFIEQLLRKAI